MIDAAEAGRLAHEFLDEIVRRTPGAAPGQFSYAGGDYLVDVFDDGTLLSRRVDWSVRVSAPEGAIVTRITSADPGTWSADGNTITVSEAAGTAEVSIFLDMGGGLVPVPFGDQTVDSPSMGGAGTYECVDDVLRITIELEGAPFTSRFDRVG